MKSLVLPIALAALLLPAPAQAQQQRADPDFRPRVAAPAYPRAQGPRVSIDEGHDNFHTADGRYAPFAALLRADGYRVSGANGWPASTLAQTDILVIANLLTAPGDAEADALREWVAGGGSLLLLADHAPFGSAAARLAARFGVDMGQGYVVTQGAGGQRVTTTIDYEGARLGRHPILAGRNGEERVRHVTAFTGQSLGAPAGATVLLQLPSDAFEVPGVPAVQALQRGERTSGRNVGTRAQGIAFPFGKGRVVVLGEAAMFSAQISVQGKPMGMNAPGNDDRQFALNTLHWLSRAL